MRKPPKGLDVFSSEAIEARIDEMERKLERLRGLYESFFLGTERAPPNVPRRELNRLLLETQQMPIHNASLRFRFQSLMQKWVVLTTYWNRTLREIEAGTFRRDLAKAHRFLAERGGAFTEADAIRLGIPASRAKAFVERQQRLSQQRPTPVVGVPELVAAMNDVTGAVKASAEGVPSGPVPLSVSGPVSAPVRPASAAIPGVREGQVEAFYEKYVAAHEQATGTRPALSFDQMRERLRKEIPRILGDKNCKAIDLDVVVDAGKVRLRARPIRG